MASSSTKAPCATCVNKAPGIFRCEGCLNVFCRKHLNEHRDILSHQLDEIVLEHDTLQQTISENKDKQTQQHPILKQIDKWEKDSIIKIREVAQQAREQVKQMTTTSSQTASKELHDLAKLLEKARTDDDYVETDLQTWTAMLRKLKDDLNTYSSPISIQEDQRQILVSKMYVLMPIAHRGNQIQRFGESYGDIRIEKDGLMATHCGLKNSDAYVRGSNEYSSGKHHIRFIFKQSMTQHYIAFFMVSKLSWIKNKFHERKAYGWTSGDKLYHNGTIIESHTNQDMRNQTVFEIELQFDCDNRKISYINQKTKNRREIDVDISNCPFPWQVEFYMYAVGDCVTLLP